MGMNVAGSLDHALGPLVAGPNYRAVGTWLQNGSFSEVASKTGISCAIVRHRAGRGGEPLTLLPELSSAWTFGSLYLDRSNKSYQAAIGLLLDGALALQTANGPIYGPQAAKYLGLARPKNASPNETMKISMRAMAFVAQSPNEDIHSLTADLYYFGRKPLTRTMMSRLQDAEAISAMLGLDRVDHEPEVARWFSAREHVPGWFQWRAGDGVASPEKWKIYINLGLEALIDRLPDLASSLASSRAQAFKIAGNAHGTCRPDRLVAYFGSEDKMRDAAAALMPLVGGLPAEPLPFTVAFDDEGRLSYGRDPARGTLEYLQGRSWRLWLCGHLARAMVAAREAPVDNYSAPLFALLRVGFLGLDPRDFSPLAGGGNGH